MKRLLSIIISLISVVSHALPVDEGRARNIASAFFTDISTRASGPEVELVWAGRNFPAGMQDFVSSNISQDAYLYVYNRVSANGFVVVSGETGVVPVIAFSNERQFDFRNMSPATRALMQGWCRQIQALRKANGDGAAEPHQDADDIGNVVVKYETPLWGQNAPYNIEAPIFDEGQCVTGCVATAMAMVAYHNRYPLSGVGEAPEYTWDGITYPGQVYGRTYDYDSMLMDYSGGYTDKQAAAVAALMRDMGAAVKMQYGVYESGAFDTDVLPALTNHFGYSKSSLMVNAEGYGVDEWFGILQDNITRYGPTYYSGAGNAGGHAFVLDGYTDKGYFSINYGWNGSNNGYYYLPAIEFYDRQAALLALEPDPAGTSSYRELIVLGRTFEQESQTEYRGLEAMSGEYQTGVPAQVRISGIQNRSQAAFSGNLMIALCDADGIIKENLLELEVDGLEYTYNQIYNTVLDIVITKSICEGDRLRLLYKGDDSSVWQWARGLDNETRHEAVICASAEVVSKSLELAWSRSTRQMRVFSQIPVQLSIEGGGYSASLATRPFNTDGMDLSGFPKGEYLLKVRSGSEPYEVVIIL